MGNFKAWKTALVLIVGLALGGCTVHPPGEAPERAAALAAGKAYEKQPENRTLPPLPGNPGADDLVRFALANNAAVEEQYWQWRAALEQVTIDGTEASPLAISLGGSLNNGAAALDRTVLTAQNDPMSDLVFPAKLSAAAGRSLENARAAGLRFRKAQFELRRKILAAYDDYALNAELIRLAGENIQLLKNIAAITDARNRAGAARQQDTLKAQNETDLAENDLATMQSQLPIQVAALNALLGRPPREPITLPAALPDRHAIAASDQQILDWAARTNPQLLSMVREIRAKDLDIRLAQLQYYPDFDLAVSTDLKGVTQSFLGVITVPILRREALAAAVAQARANRRGADATWRQGRYDLAGQLIDDLVTVRDADRQVDLLGHTILPRARQWVTLCRAAYESGNQSLLEWFDGQRSLIDIQRMIAALRITRDKRLADVESILACQLPHS